MAAFESVIRQSFSDAGVPSAQRIQRFAATSVTQIRDGLTSNFGEVRDSVVEQLNPKVLIDKLLASICLKNWYAKSCRGTQKTLPPATAVAAATQRATGFLFDLSDQHREVVTFLAYWMVFGFLTTAMVIYFLLFAGF